MTRVRLYIVGSLALVALAGCGSLFNFARREAWRHDAEVACLKSGAVKEGPGLVRIEPIDGPGICGADFPLRVAALNATSAIGFADELQPPGLIPNARSAQQPRWPAAQSTPLPPPSASVADVEAAAPMMLHPADGTIPSSRQAESELQVPAITPARRFYQTPPDRSSNGAASAMSQLPPLGPPSSRTTGAIGPVSVNPPAKLACPIVSALDRWIATAVQPAALRWFGQPVVAIKQISAYSCRGMNGNPHAHISEHAFGNALDIAGFTFADGRKITVKNGWHGSPEEQGFLHDVQGAACQEFTTVLSPGYNIYHYNHIHVDLMRRSRGRHVCRPAAIPGEVAAQRAARGGRYAHRGDPAVTGSIGHRTTMSPDHDDAVEHDEPPESDN